MNTTILPSFDLVFGPQSYRLRGIASWEDVPLLGKGNIGRLRMLAHGAAMRLLGDSGARDDLREVQSVIRFLFDALEAAEDRPLLPRLRVESFRKGPMFTSTWATPPVPSRLNPGSRRP